MKRTHLEYSFHRNKAIVYKSVNTIAPRAREMGIELSILEREAELAFVLAYHNWKGNSRSGNFHSFLKTCICNHLRNFLRNEYRRTKRTDVVEISYHCVLPWEGPSPHAGINYHEILDELSEDSRTVISAIFHAPEELLEDIGNTASIKLVRGALKRWLSRQGWGRGRINNAFNELGVAFG